ncbi:MAG: DNA-processing protein DprA [Chlamydiota bacterium]
MNETEAVHILMHLPKTSLHQLIRDHGSALSALSTIPWQRTESFDKDCALIEKENIKLVSYADKEYPTALKALSDFPPLLYVKGDLLPYDDSGLAIVGTRECSIYGQEMAQELAKEVASQNITIISGLARGIDTAAHIGALKSGRTVAFIGSGLSNLYPKENANLAAEISYHGAVASELPMATPPDKRHFPRRNRLVSALSKGVLLVEAPIKSGAMITMGIAHAQKKYCFALPGRADMESFRGNHFLIKKQKALLVEKGEEMISILLPETKMIKTIKKPCIELTAQEKLLIDHFPIEEVGIEALAEKTQIAISKLNALLMGLVLKRVIKEFPGKYYKRIS